MIDKLADLLFSHFLYFGETTVSAQYSYFCCSETNFVSGVIFRKQKLPQALCSVRRTNKDKIGLRYGREERRLRTQRLQESIIKGTVAGKRGTSTEYLDVDGAKLQKS